MTATRTTHGEARHGRLTPEYRVWLSLRDRCLNKNSTGYKRYGGRGITVDPRWDKYENFLEDMGRRPGSGYSIERKNNALGYSKENCEWATQVVQQNNRTNNTRLTLDGRTQTLAKWAKELGVKRATLSWRLMVGWPIERVLSAKVRFQVGRL